MPKLKHETDWLKGQAASEQQPRTKFRAAPAQTAHFEFPCETENQKAIAKNAAEDAAKFAKKTRATPAPAKTVEASHEDTRKARLHAYEAARTKYGTLSIVEKLEAWDKENPELVPETMINLPAIRRNCDENLADLTQQARKEHNANLPKKKQTRVLPPEKNAEIEYLQEMFVQKTVIKALLSKIIGQTATKKMLNGMLQTALYEATDARTPGYKKGAFDASAALRHLAFIGNSGAGKTKAAKLTAKVYFLLGLVPSPTVRLVKASDMIGGFLGETHGKVKAVLKSVGAGIVLVDEAQFLYGGPRKQGYESDAIVSLMEEMEDPNAPAVFFCGYIEGVVRGLVEHDAGMERRVTYVIECDNLTIEELASVFVIMVEDTNFKLDSRITMPQVEALLERNYSDAQRAHVNAGTCQDAVRNLKLYRAERASESNKIMMEIMTDRNRRYTYSKEELEGAMGMKATQKGLREYHNELEKNRKREREEDTDESSEGEEEEEASPPPFTKKTRISHDKLKHATIGKKEEACVTGCGLPCLFCLNKSRA